MRRLVFFSFIVLIPVLLSACKGQADSGITPAPDRPTFIYFYTDG